MAALQIYHSTYKDVKIFRSAKTHPGSRTRSFIAGSFPNVKKAKYTLNNTASEMLALERCRIFIDKLNSNDA